MLEEHHGHVRCSRWGVAGQAKKQKVATQYRNNSSPVNFESAERFRAQAIIAFAQACSPIHDAQVLDAAARSGQGDASIELSSRMLESSSNGSSSPGQLPLWFGELDKPTPTTHSAMAVSVLQTSKLRLLSLKAEVTRLLELGPSHPNRPLGGFGVLGLFLPCRSRMFGFHDSYYLQSYTRRTFNSQSMHQF